MQVAIEQNQGGFVPDLLPETQAAICSAYPDHEVIRRNGALVGFAPWKISIAMTKAFLAVSGGRGAVSARIRELVGLPTRQVAGVLVRCTPSGRIFHFEDVQEQVELALMRSGEHEVARAYALCRAKRNQARALHRRPAAKPAQSVVNIIEGGQARPLASAAQLARGGSACEGSGSDAEPARAVRTASKNIYEGIPGDVVRKSLILAASTRADHAEKPTGHGGVLNAVSSDIQISESRICSIDDLECEACQ